MNRAGTFLSIVGAGTFHSELIWHQEKLLAFNLGPMAVYNSLKEKLYLPTIIKILGEVLQGEWIRLGLETFTEVVVNKSVLIRIQQKSLSWPKTSIDRKLIILVSYRHTISHPS